MIPLEKEMSDLAIEEAGFTSGAVAYSSGQGNIAAAGLASLGADVERVAASLGARVLPAAEATETAVSSATKLSTSERLGSALGYAWRDPGFSGSFIRLATVVGGIAIAYEGINYFFDSKRSQKLNDLIQDPSIPEDLKRQALTNYINSLSRPASIFDQFGTIIIIGGATVGGILLLNWYLKRRTGGI